MDTFLEYMVTKRKETKDYLRMVGIFIGLLVGGFILINLLAAFHLASVVPAVFFVIIWLIYYLVTAQSLEFEYIVTNADLDIDRISAKRKRKRLTTINLRQIELVAPLKDNRFTHQFGENIQKTIFAAESETAEGVYGLIVRSGEGRTKLIFQPTERMLTHIKKFNPPNVHIQG